MDSPTDPCIGIRVENIGLFKAARWKRVLGEEAVGSQKAREHAGEDLELVRKGNHGSILRRRRHTKHPSLRHTEPVIDSAESIQPEEGHGASVIAVASYG